MRYLLDTNIVVYIGMSEFDKIAPQTNLIINDYNNQLYTSSITAVEIVQLYNNNKIKSKKYKTAKDFIDAIEKVFFIKILPFTKEHVETFSKLKLSPKHKDPFDHSIISQAITDKFILVSSDKAFEDYVSQKLIFFHNKR